MNDLIKQVAGTDQDFEWYPTTNEILNVLCKNTDEHASILDIGAGNGKVLKRFTGDKYAIEKSRPLLDSLPSDVIIVGVDFDQNTLIDKEVDLIFCNPPYSEYERWTERIIKEANADKIFLVIPRRWTESKAISNAIKDRCASSKVLGIFDFKSSEDRKARAVVDLVRIHLGEREKYEYITPFAIFFKETFGDIKVEKKNSWDLDKERKKVIDTELVKSGDLVTTLINLYNADIKKLHKNYTAITSLDSDVLSDFDIDIDLLLKGLRLRIKGLKNLYWSQLFERFDKVTDRLTSYARDAFLSRIFRNTSVDFNLQNIHAVADWVIRNANLSFEDQILEFYERMLEKANCSAYKSNKKVFENQDWGWSGKRDGEDSNVFAKLSNIIIISNGVEFGNRWSGETLTLGIKGTDYFNDLTIIANQLGFPVHAELMENDGLSGLNLDHHRNCNVERSEKYHTWFSKNGHPHELYQVKFFKNGNIHIKFNRNFMNKLNIIYGRLKGWISNPQDAENEMDINLKEATKHFNYDVPNIGIELLQLGEVR